MLGSRVAWLAPMALTACSFAPVGLEGRACPCVAGYRCEASRCVRDTDAAPDAPDVSPADAGSDATGDLGADPDASIDASIDASMDVPADIPTDAPFDGPADAPTDAPVDAPPACPPADNNYGTPAVTYTLPITPAQSYVGDVQAWHPEVDWANLDRLYIPAGSYGGIYLGNMPARARSHPLVITNQGGQVEATSITLAGGSGWVLTGRYDPVSQTGDAAFPGHRGGMYANTQGRYGFFLRADANALAQVDVEDDATDYDIEFVEVARGTYASIVVRTRAGDVQNVRVHDNYVHDGEGVGIWFAQHSGGTGVFRNVRVDHNRVVRTTDAAVLLHSVREGCRLDHNAIVLPTTNWLNGAGAAWGLQLAPEGGLELDHNTIAGPATGFFEAFLAGAGTSGMTARAHDEWYADSYAQVASLRTADSGELAFSLSDSRFGRIRYGFDTVYPGSRAPDPVLSVEPTANAITVSGNQYETEPARALAPTAPNVTASGNTQTALGSIPFVDALPGDDASYDLPAVTFWSPTQNRSPTNTTRTYARGERVTRLGRIYECIVDASTNEPPESTPSSWRDLGVPPDDLRVDPAACDVGAP